MFLMYRVLNEFDIACNPMVNGLASKKLIYDMTLSYLEANESKFLSGLSEIEKDNYCKQCMLSYIKSHQYKLKKVIDKRGSFVRENLEMFNYGDTRSLYYLVYCLSTLNTHLISGSKVYTDWISMSKDINCISKYYQEQSIHKVLVAGYASGGLCDQNTIVVDLSSKDIIREILPLISKKISDVEFKKIKDCFDKRKGFYSLPVDSDIFIRTSDKFMGFNFSTHDKEVCVYRYFPSERVISVLEALQIDLLSIKLFNFEFLTLPVNEQIKQLNFLKEVLKKEIIKLNDPYMLHIFEELYLNNKNIKDIRENMFEDDKIKHTRVKILKLAKDIPNIQIKR